MRCGQNPSLEPQNAVKGTVTHHYNTQDVYAHADGPLIYDSLVLLAPNSKPKTCRLAAIQFNDLEKKRSNRTSVERLGKKMTAQIRQIGTCHLPPAQRYS